MCEIDSGLDTVSTLQENLEFSGPLVLVLTFIYFLASFFSKRPSNTLIFPIWYPFLTKIKYLYSLGMSSQLFGTFLLSKEFSLKDFFFENYS